MIPAERRNSRRRNRSSGAKESGSALVMAIFVLVLLTAMGIGLLFVTENEMKMGQVDLRSKKIFYVAEAALEDARETLRVVNKSSPVAANRETLDDELQTAAGADGLIGFNAAAVKPVYDSSGNPTGFTGYSDDVPLKAMTTFGDSRYIAFLTNDPPDGKTNTHDTNDRALITALAAGPRNSMEMVQAIVEHLGIPAFPSTITILGPNATFDGGTSNAKQYTGNDCAIPTLHLPVVGVIGAGSESSAELGVHKPANYTSGTNTGVNTVDNIEGTIDPDWNNCQYLHKLARQVRAMADVVGNSSTPNSELTSGGGPKIIYIEGDYYVGPSINGTGLLWVTGTLTFHGGAGWSGAILTVGRGNFVRTGAGNGSIYGANLVANIAGPDGAMWTSDDCAGADGVVGTADDGIASGVYNNDGGGTGMTGYCSTSISNMEDQLPFEIVDFRQR